MKKIKIGKYKFKSDNEIKCIPDGWEVLPDTVKKYDITPEDFESAYWQEDSIIVEINKLANSAYFRVFDENWKNHKDFESLREAQAYRYTTYGYNGYIIEYNPNTLIEIANHS